MLGGGGRLPPQKCCTCVTIFYQTSRNSIDTRRYLLSVWTVSCPGPLPRGSYSTFWIDSFNPTFTFRLVYSEPICLQRNATSNLETDISILVYITCFWPFDLTLNMLYTVCLLYYNMSPVVSKSCTSILVKIFPSPQHMETTNTIFSPTHWFRNLVRLLVKICRRSPQHIGRLQAPILVQHMFLRKVFQQHHESTCFPSRQ